MKHRKKFKINDTAMLLVYLEDEWYNVFSKLYETTITITGKINKNEKNQISKIISKCHEFKFWSHHTQTNLTFMLNLNLYRTVMVLILIKMSYCIHK